VSWFPPELVDCGQCGGLEAFALGFAFRAPSRSCKEQSRNMIPLGDSSRTTKPRNEFLTTARQSVAVIISTSEKARENRPLRGFGARWVAFFDGSLTV
jgi:hypothetical protein